MKLLLIFSLSILGLAAPSFLNEKTSQRGHLLEINCDAVGPDTTTAKVATLNNCRLLAADFLKQKIKVQSTSIQTETDVALHSSVQSEVIADNLSCKVLHETCEESEGQAHCYLRCSFDLSKVRAVNNASKETKDSVQSIGEQENKNIDAELATSIKSDRRSFFISTIPQCSSILIEGKKPRIVRCRQNPIAVTLDSSDKLIIVRANGYKAKSVQAKEILNQDSEEVQFVLSK